MTQRNLDLVHRVGGLTLREYQDELIVKTRASIKIHRSTVLQAPTGAGKGVIIAFMMGEAAARGWASAFVVHRKELLEQVSEKLHEIRVPHGVIAGSRTPTSEPIQIATVQTLANRTHMIRTPKLLIIDEAHHAAARSYRKVIEAWPEAYVIGLTATPARLDGRGLNDLFKDMVLGPSVEWLIDNGYLSPFRVFAPSVGGPDLSGVKIQGGDYVAKELEQIIDQGAIIGDAVAHYRRLVHPRTCLVFCVSRTHARHVAAAYREQGINAVYCGGDTPRAERKATIAGLRDGSQPVVTSVDLFGEGLDAPGLAAIQMLRPTYSLTLFLQMCGRALRVEGGKEYAIILDHVGNVQRHGFPDDAREWTLEGARKRKKKGEQAIALRHCKNCFGVYPAARAKCPNCGAGAERSVRTGPEEVAGELVELTKEQQRINMQRKKRAVAIALRACSTLEDYVKVAREFKHKPGWAAYQFGLRTGDTSPRNMGRAQRIWREQAVGDLNGEQT